MLLSSNNYEGTPPRLYRAPSEIKSDILRIKDEIKEIEDMLTVRNVILEIISASAGKDPSRWIPELESIVYDARDALDRLTEFFSLLQDLREELEDTRCAMGY